MPKLREIHNLKIKIVGHTDKIMKKFPFGLIDKINFISIFTGAGGAYCLLCFATEEDANNLDKIFEGFKIERNIKLTWETFIMLTKGKTRPIPKKTGDQDIRKGQTQEPMIEGDCIIDPHRGNPSMHFIIHVFDVKKKLFVTLHVRKANNGILPERGSKGRGNKTDPEVEKLYKEAMEAFTTRCKEKLNLTVNAPDPHGHGGSAENGNTCRIFLHEKNREKTLSIYEDLVSEDEFEHLQLMLQEANVIYRAANTIGKMHTKEFGDYIKSAYYNWKKNFPFYKVKESIHWTLGHLAELISLNDDYSLAESSEGSLECSHKNYRRIEATLALQTSFLDNCTTSLKKMWIDSNI